MEDGSMSPIELKAMIFFDSAVQGCFFLGIPWLLSLVNVTESSGAETGNKDAYTAREWVDSGKEVCYIFRLE